VEKNQFRSKLERRMARDKKRTKVSKRHCEFNAKKEVRARKLKRNKEKKGAEGKDRDPAQIRAS